MSGTIVISTINRTYYFSTDEWNLEERGGMLILIRKSPPSVLTFNKGYWQAMEVISEGDPQFL